MKLLYRNVGFKALISCLYNIIVGKFIKDISIYNCKNNLYQ